MAAKMKASGTARPMSPAGAVPLRAIAAVGAMIAIDSAIASQKRNSRRSPLGLGVAPRSEAGGSLGPGAMRAAYPKIAWGKKAPTTQLGASTTSWIRKSTATDAIA
jgi:hypothetical protein